MKRLLLLFILIQNLPLYAFKNHINMGVEPNFSVNKDSICSKEVILITDLTIGNATSYSWSFGINASPSTAFGKGPFLIKYSSGGYKKITLIVDGNLSISKDSAVFVKLSPSASFLVNDSDQCIGNNIYFFDNTSLNANKFKWQLGENSEKLTQNVTYSYGTAGFYNVILFASSNLNCIDTTSSMIHVFNKPKADFKISNTNQCLKENLFRIKNTSKSDKPFTTIFLLGDGNGRLEDTFSYKYDLMGNYNILLSVSNGNGCQDTISKNIQVLNNPKSNFTINNANQCLNNNTFIFTNMSLNNHITKWLFGDNTNSKNQNDTHKYTEEGKFKVQLISVGENFCNDTLLLYTTVYPSPLCLFTINDSNQCLSNNFFEFEAKSIISNGNITNSWILPNGNEEIKNIFQDIYGVPGTFAIKLLTKSDKNCTDTMVKKIVIFPNPNPFFNIDTSSDKTIFFEAIDKFHKEYIWFLSDGYKENRTIFSRTFTANGKYSAQLVVKDMNDCIDSSYFEFNINAFEYKTFKNNIELYPNPTTKNNTIIITLEKPSDVIIEMYNSLGQIVYNTQKNNSIKGVHVFNLPFETSKLAKGIYWLKIKINETMKIEKIIFQ